MSSQLSIFGPDPDIEVAADEPPAIVWPDAEDEPAPESPVEQPAVIADPADLFKRWCRGAWLKDAEMNAVKDWALANQ